MFGGWLLFRSSCLIFYEHQVEGGKTRSTPLVHGRKKEIRLQRIGFFVLSSIPCTSAGQTPSILQFRDQVHQMRIGPRLYLWEALKFAFGLKAMGLGWGDSLSSKDTVFVVWKDVEG